MLGNGCFLKLQQRLQGLGNCTCTFVCVMCVCVCVYLQPQPLRYHPDVYGDEDDSLLAVIDDEGAAVQTSVYASSRLP